MFGYVTANLKELDREQQLRYNSVYCGICRRIRSQSGQTARLGLSYDMAFLALLLMSLYEPEETCGKSNCLPHPFHRKPWVDNEYIRYAADMNVALSYYNFLDDWQDDASVPAKVFGQVFSRYIPRIREQYPRQCQAIEDCISQLSQLEKENCSNPDIPAACFGQLMAQLLVYREDMWALHLQQMGNALGRFIYLLDAVMDYDKDCRKNKYNPFLAMGTGKEPQRWEDYLVLTIGRCTDSFERLPLVQDKALLDNILYSGVWIRYRASIQKEDLT